MRAIDADAMKDYIDAQEGRPFIGCTVGQALKIMTDEQPTIQPEIIYCKDCGHRDDHGCCKYWRGLAMSEIPIATDDYDFCKHARRREREVR